VYYSHNATARPDLLAEGPLNNLACKMRPMTVTKNKKLRFICRRFLMPGNFASE
jgi:hypothetical protein